MTERGKERKINKEEKADNREKRKGRESSSFGFLMTRARALNANRRKYASLEAKIDRILIIVGALKCNHRKTTIGTITLPS